MRARRAVRRRNSFLASATLTSLTITDEILGLRDFFAQLAAPLPAAMPSLRCCAFPSSAVQLEHERERSGKRDFPAELPSAFSTRSVQSALSLHSHQPPPLPPAPLSLAPYHKMLYATSTRIIAYAASMSYRGWLVSIVLSALTYLYNASTSPHPRYNSPCVRFGAVMRVLYGLFATDFAHYVLGSLCIDARGRGAPDSAFNTRVSTHGPPEMRIQLVPILGGLFGGNYSFLIWDDNDPQRRAIVVDPADPHVMLQAAKKERLKVELLLCTHWHFDHSAGNQTFKRFIPGIEVVASASERGRTPAVTRRVKDLDELQCGPRLTVRCHHVPGHTHGSIVYEVVSKAGDGSEGSSGSPSHRPPSRAIPSSVALRRAS